MSKLRETQSRVSDLIWALRRDNGWSQQKLADILGTSRSQICRLESPATCKPNIETLVNLARVFKKDLVIEFTPVD